MKLNLTPLVKAVEQLEKSLKYANSEMAKKDKDLFEQFRNSVIQCFEFTYEISWKMLKRQIEKDSPSPELIDTYSYNDLIREAAERGLVDDPQKWFDFRHYRNLTSHAYDREKAQQVFLAASDLLVSTKSLLNQLQAKN
jgi:nucleotidyltransferase substrate binding protein (TIGR01987 family)